MFKVLFHLNKEYPQYNILVINKEERLFKINPCSLEIISGMAKGADTLAVKFANKYNLALKEFRLTGIIWMYHHVELLQIRMEAIMH